MILLAALLLAAQPADNAAAAPPPSLPDRYSTLIVFGDDPCPRSSQDEVVVCARLPENDRFRLPKRFRGKKGSEGPASVAWSQKARSLEYVSRDGIPNSCSPVGSFGATGCFQKFLREAREQREADAQERADVP